MVRFSEDGLEGGAASASGERPSALAKSGTRKLSSQPSRKVAAEGMKAVLGIAAQQSVSAKDKDTLEKKGLLASNDSFEGASQPSFKRELSAQKAGGRALGKSTTMAQREVNHHERRCMSPADVSGAPRLNFETCYHPSRHIRTFTGTLDALISSCFSLCCLVTHLQFNAGCTREGCSNLPQIRFSLQELA